MNAKEAVRHVLKEAANAQNFFDYSDSERLGWMLARSFKLGMKVARGNALSPRNAVGSRFTPSAKR
ncbi:MAG: hypothetical protein H7144_10055 [Burkholderiales bacterium]|nr:hypothetical protein [Phycisphaerae bacterium]